MARAWNRSLLLTDLLLHVTGPQLLYACLEAHGNQAMIRWQENVGVATYGLDRREREVFCTRIVVEQPTELDFPSETET